MKKRIKVNGIIIFFTVVVITIFPGAFLAQPHLAFFDSLRMIFGLGLILLGQVLRVSSRGYKAEHSQQSRLLIRGGPYKLVRHPMYLGILLIGFGIVLALFRWWVVLAFLVFYISRYSTLMIKEEKKLLQNFPEEYKKYIKDVPRRIIPSGRLFFKTDVREYLPMKPDWLYKELASMVCVLCGVIAVNAYQYIKEEGVFYLQQIPAILAILGLFVAMIMYLMGKLK